MQLDTPPPKYLLRVVLGCALALRLLYVYTIRDTPVGELLLIDSEFYHREALRIIRDGWLGDRLFFMNPFYSYFLAIIYSLSGVHFWLVGVVQALLGTVSCYWVFALGKRIWGAWEGVIAAAFMACCGVLIFYDGSLLTASPILFLNLAALVSLVQWENSRQMRWLFTCGLLLGLSALARPMILLFAVLITPWFLRLGNGHTMPRIGSIWLGIFLVLFPVVVRNYVVGDEWGLTTSAAGMNFYVGNHRDATGIYSQASFLNSAEPDREREGFIREAQRRSGQMLSAAEASRYWLVQGVSYIRSQPYDYLLLLGRKLYMFANRIEAQNNLSFYFARDYAPQLYATIVGWWLLAPLAAGAWIFCRERRNYLLDLYFLSYLLACLAFFVSSEYRLPVLPVLALYSGCFVVDCISCLRRYSPFYTLKRLVVVALVAVPVNYADALASRLTMRRVDYYNFGALYERKGDGVRAEQMFRKSLSIDEGFAPAQKGIERLLKRRRAGYETEAIGGEDNIITAALDAYADRRYLRARNLLQIAIEMGTQRASVYNNLGLVYYKMGSTAEAARAFEQAIVLAPDYVKAHYNLGLVHMANEDYLQADSSYARALEIDPDYRQALYKRGQLAARQGYRVLALKYWRDLKKLVGDDNKLQVQIDSLLKEL